MKHLSFARLLSVTALGFALTMVANTLEPSVLGRKILELAPANPNTALGFVTLAGLLVAIFVQPIVGVMSDRTRSPWGRRLPYLAAGSALVILCLFVIAAAPAFAVLVAGVLLIQLASNTVQGPWQALIPDQVPALQRGRAAGLKAFLDILALVAGRGAAGYLVSLYPRLGTTAIMAAVAVPSIVYALALSVTALGAAEKPGALPPVASARAQSLRQALADTFHVDFHAHPAFRWWFANRLLFWAAFIALNTFLLFYLINVIGMAEAPANQFIGRLSLVLGAALALVAVPMGWLADRIGRKPVVMAAGLLAAAGTGVILVARTPGMLTLAGAVIGLGIGSFLSANWALVTDIVPQGEAARYLGIANVATAGGSALARFLGGALIDPLNRAFGSPAAGYLVLYGIAAAFFLLSAVAVVPLPGQAQAQATWEGEGAATPSASL